MQIIAGVAKGARLQTPQGSATRPTASTVKEAFFSSMEYEGLQDGYFADLYAGTAQMAFESLSRGAPGAVITDSSGKAFRLIKENYAKIKTYFPESKRPDVHMAKQNALAAVAYMMRKHIYPSIIYFDPPWKNMQNEIFKVFPAIRDGYAAVFKEIYLDEIAETSSEIKFNTLESAEFKELIAAKITKQYKNQGLIDALDRGLQIVVEAESDSRALRFLSNIEIAKEKKYGSRHLIFCLMTFDDILAEMREEINA